MNPEDLHNVNFGSTVFAELMYQIRCRPIRTVYRRFIIHVFQNSKITPFVQSKIRHVPYVLTLTVMDLRPGAQDRCGYRRHKTHT